jgi:hypothetical protein
LPWGIFLVFPIPQQGCDQIQSHPDIAIMKKCYVQHLDLLSFSLSSHMEDCGQADFCTTFIVANSILHNKRLKLAQLDLIQTHHARSQAPV